MWAYTTVVSGGNRTRGETGRPRRKDGGDALRGRTICRQHTQTHDEVPGQEVVPVLESNSMPTRYWHVQRLWLCVECRLASCWCHVGLLSTVTALTSLAFDGGVCVASEFDNADFDILQYKSSILHLPQLYGLRCVHEKNSKKHCGRVTGWKHW